MPSDAERETGDGRLKTKDRRLVLASASPRRRELLEKEGFRLHVVSPEVEEQHQPHETPEAYVARNADEKADWVTGQVELQNAWAVIAADTVVVLDGHILEKPGDASEAVSMLTRLSGRTHEVFTGVSLRRLRNGEVTDRIGFVETTRVHFRDLPDDEIRAYVASGEPMDKAGSYAIQGRGGALVDRIEGSYSNVVGLPVERVLEALDLEG